MQDWLNSLFARLREQKGMTTWIWVVILFVVLGIGVLLGLPFDRPGTAETTAPAFGSTGQLVSVFLKWMAVIGLMYVAFIFLRRWQPGGATARVKQISILERLSLSQRQAILLVRVGNRKLLLGATDQNISLITELGDGDEILAEENPGEFQDGNTGFNTLLQKKMSAPSGNLFDGLTKKKE